MIRIPTGPTISIGRHRLGIHPIAGAWPPIHWNHFGATGWTPILLRIYIWPFCFSWFYKNEPRRIEQPLAPSDHKR